MLVGCANGIYIGGNDSVKGSAVISCSNIVYGSGTDLTLANSTALVVKSSIINCNVNGVVSTIDGDFNIL